jgi:hypothetical protein
MGNVVLLLYKDYVLNGLKAYTYGVLLYIFVPLHRPYVYAHMYASLRYALNSYNASITMHGRQVVKIT